MCGRDLIHRFVVRLVDIITTGLGVVIATYESAPGEEPKGAAAGQA
jgi:hypothetical protein